MNQIKTITSGQDYSNATRNGGVVVVKCGATWCEPCVKCDPAYAELAHTSRARFYTLDIDEVPEFEDRDFIKMVPTFLIFVDGTPDSSIVGPDIPALAHIVDELIQKNE